MNSDDRKPLLNTLILIVLILIFWEVCYLIVGDVALRSPWQTVHFLGKLMQTDTFWGHLSESMQAFAWALVIAVAMGLAIGFALGLHRLSGDAFEPMLVALYSIPKITLYPILLLNVSAAMANVDPSLREAAQNLGAGYSRLFRTITLPLISPCYFAGEIIVFI